MATHKPAAELLMWAQFSTLCQRKELLHKGHISKTNQKPWKYWLLALGVRGVLTHLNQRKKSAVLPARQLKPHVQAMATKDSPNRMQHLWSPRCVWPKPIESSVIYSNSLEFLKLPDSPRFFVFLKRLRYIIKLWSRIFSPFKISNKRADQEIKEIKWEYNVVSILHFFSISIILTIVSQKIRYPLIPCFIMKIRSSQCFTKLRAVESSSNLLTNNFEWETLSGLLAE